MSRVTLIFTMALCLTVQLHSQVRGRVLDQAGAVIAGARVILKSSSGDKEIAKAVTDEKGEYSLSAAAGVHSIEASSTCFLTVRYKPFYTVGRVQSLDFVLPVADCGGTPVSDVRPKPPEPLDFCDVLSNLPKYRDKTIAVRGEYIVHEHGRVIAKEKCPSPLITSGHTWPTMISLELSPNTKVDAPCRLAMATLPPDTKFWVTVEGLLETRAPLAIVVPFVGKTVPDGYGHLNSYPAQLVYHQMRDCTWKTR